MISVLVVGGAGAMGTLLVGLLGQQPDVALTVVDLPVVRASGPAPGEPTSLRWLEADIEVPGPELLAALAGAEVVILALPEAVAERAAATVFCSVHSGALIVDTLSVKTGWFSQIALHLDTTRPHPEVLSINPMFAPALGFAGRGVAVVSIQDGPLSVWFCDLMGRWGADLVVMGQTEHDRCMASIQAATHASVLAFGLAMSALGHDLDRLWPALTPPHRTMLSLAARMGAGDAHVYHDIQHANPFAAEARQAVADGLRSVAEAAATSDPAGFGALLDQVTAVLGSHRSELEEHCVRLFGVPVPGPGLPSAGLTDAGRSDARPSEIE